MTVAPVILLGPTASGKSGLALAVAAALAPSVRIEIISIDSAQVYRGMDIGTAKPTAAERKAVPHHGIDLIDPAESYSAAQFVADAQGSVAQIQARGAWPWLVGGTMLYVKALQEGLDSLPPSNAAVRARLDEQLATHGVAALYARLQQVDAATALRLKPTDTQRIQRALEVYELAGKPLSQLQGQARPRPAAADWPTVSLEPQDRSWLHRRIAQRFDDMLQAGLLAEAEALRARGDLHAELPSIRCVGYRQAWEALDKGSRTPPTLPTPLTPGSPAWQALREQGVAATRQLAKRQLTWLRSLPVQHRIAADAPDALAQLLSLARHWLTLDTC